MRTFGVKIIISQFYGVKIPQNSPKFSRIGTSQPNPRRREAIKAIRVKFERQIENGKKYPKSAKIMSKGVMWGSRDPHLEFWEPPDISGTIEARNFKFGTQRAAVSSNKKCKVWSKGSRGGHVTQFWNFETP